MGNTNLSPRSVESLFNENFFIPTYQRGYRWSTQQVTELLDDIWEFTLTSQSKDIYCLQPIVVIKRGGKFEVIDGQQRLTTLHIILTYINNRFNTGKKIFTIEYASRPRSEEFLQNIDFAMEFENVDFYHMTQAWRTIDSWFNNAKDFLGTTMKFYPILSEKVHVIWYDIGGHEDTDPKEIFTRLNVGKIPLTDAELIKALFLKADNFTIASGTEVNDRWVKLKQLEIASEWDRIEYSLQQMGFWYFLTAKEPPPGPRISFILDVIAGNEQSGEEYHTFHYFYELYKDSKEDSIFKATSRIWNFVKKFYMTLNEWYHDRELYHLIGYLLAVSGESKKPNPEHSIKALQAKSSIVSKSDFKNYLRAEIGSTVNIDLDTVRYGNREKVKNILLLFNVESILRSSDVSSRFPFDKYKDEDWDIEHIHAVKSRMPEGINHQKEWLTVLVYEMGASLNDALKSRALLFVENPDLSLEPFENIFTDAVNCYGNSDDEEFNGIGNLTLLDASLNRSYKNAIFPIKRRKIIKKDETGAFIPLCTKNVFLKHYIEAPDQLTVWSRSECVTYKNKIRQILEPYQSGI